MSDDCSFWCTNKRIWDMTAPTEAIPIFSAVKSDKQAETKISPPSLSITETWICCHEMWNK